MTRLTLDDVYEHISGVCFKTGPPGQVGAETEALNWVPDIDFTGGIVQNFVPATAFQAAGIDRLLWRTREAISHLLPSRKNIRHR